MIWKAYDAEHECFVNSFNQWDSLNTDNSALR